MKMQASRKLLGTYVLATAVAVTLFVSPWNSVDPVNLPKLFLLGIFAFISVGISITQWDYLLSKENRVLVSVVFLTTGLLLVNLLIGASDFSFKLYGTPSRNTGFLAYFSLTFITLAACISASFDFIKKYSYALVATGGLLAIYGLAQSRGLDFFDYVNAYGSNVFGTFGNPNFQSAFMGMAASAALVWVFFGNKNVIIRAGLFLLVLLALLNVKLSSEQGYLNFLAGIVSAIIIYLFAKRKFILGWSLLGVASSGVILLGLGLFNNGPLADLIYKSSLQARGFYWRAAIKMMVEHPFIGVGFDGFGDWYRRSRTQAVAEFNSGIVADTAHSIPLDLGSSGGFPLLFAYLALIFFALISIIKVIKRRSGFDVAYTSVVAAWVAYQAQSFISINQLGLGVWGWSLSGLIIGYEINTRTIESEALVKNSHKLSKVENKISAGVLVVAFVGGCAGLIISLPPYLAANKYYKALQSGDGNLVQQSAYLKPYDRTRFLYSAKIMMDNKLDGRAIEILRDASKIYPDNFEVWQQWSQIPSATPEEITKAKSEMKRLDPFNPNLK